MATFSIVLTFMIVFLSTTVLGDKNFKRENWEKNPLMLKAPGSIPRIRLLRQEILDNGCDTNICFVLEASALINEQEWDDQKNFVDLIVAITTTDKGGNYCASIYDKGFERISPLTKDKINFLDLVQRETRPYEGSYSPNILPGLGYSIKQLRRQRKDANTIIFFSKAKPAITKAPYFFQQFVERGNAISAVTFNTANAPDLAKLTGDINRIVPIDGFFEVSETIVAVVADVCSTKCTTLPDSRTGELRRRRRQARGACPTRLGKSRFKFYKGVGGVGVGFGSSTPVNPKRAKKIRG